jgi:hypothetical protein
MSDSDASGASHYGWLELMSNELRIIQEQETEKDHVHMIEVRLRMNQLRRIR